MAKKERSEEQEDFLSLLDEDQVEIVAKLLDEEPLPFGELRDEVSFYMHQVRDEAVDNGIVDLDMAEDIAEAARALITYAAGLGDPEAHLFIHAAVRYFVMEDDAEDDFASPIGFDDDAEVMSAVAIVLDRPDLEIELLD